MHTGSPSLSSVILSRLLEVLYLYSPCHRRHGHRDTDRDRARRIDVTIEDDDDRSFKSCIDDIDDDDDDDDDGGGMWYALTTECYLPMLRLLDAGVHADVLRRMCRGTAAMASNDGGMEPPSAVARTRAAVAPDRCDRRSATRVVSEFGRAIHDWTTSWFASANAMPMSVSARVVDFLMASHPAMPM